MTVDSEKQRETLLNCIDSCQLSGMAAQLFAVLQEIAEVREAVKSASISQDAVASGVESGLRIVSAE